MMVQHARSGPLYTRFPFLLQNPLMYECSAREIDNAAMEKVNPSSCLDSQYIPRCPPILKVETLKSSRKRYQLCIVAETSTRVVGGRGDWLAKTG